MKLNEFGIPKRDLFAYRINHQIERYISWKQDSKAIAIDAFSVKWNTKFFQIYSPCSLLGNLEAKMHRDNTKCIADMPKWTTQHWYQSLMKKAKNSTIIQPSLGNLIQPQDPEKLHLLHQKMRIQQLLIN